MRFGRSCMRFNFAIGLRNKESNMEVGDAALIELSRVLGNAKLEGFNMHNGVIALNENSIRSV